MLPRSSDSSYALECRETDADRRRNRAAYWLWVFVVLAGAIWLRKPALEATLFADDWDHYAIESGLYPIKLPVWDMFRWVSDRASDRAALLESGRLPWWSAPDIHLAVFRPLASLLTHFDYAVMHGLEHPERLHLHTLGWWIFLVLGIAAVMEAVLPLPIAALSVLMYAVDDGHIAPFGWAANRSQIVAMAFVVWALCAHLRAEREASIKLRIAVLVLTALGLAAGEHAFAPLAYLPAASFILPGNVPAKLRRLVPLGILVVLYVVMRSRLGYGVGGSGFYIDLMTEPLRYARASLTRIPLLFSELVFSAPSEWWYWGFPWHDNAFLRNHTPDYVWSLSFVRTTLVILGGIGVALSLATVRWLGRATDHQGERALQWLLIGALVSIVPLVGTIVLGRMTLTPAIAFNAVFAYAIWRTASRAFLDRRFGQRALWTCTATALIGLNIVVPAQRSRIGAYQLSAMSSFERAGVLRADFGGDDLTGKHVFVLAATDVASQFYISYIRHSEGRSVPTISTSLSPVGETQVLTRVDDRTIVLKYPHHSEVLPPFNGSLYRAETEPLRAGDHVAAALFDVDVLAARNGQPTLLRFIFRTSVDDPTLVFMVPIAHQLTRIAMPPVGRQIIIPPPGHRS